MGFAGDGGTADIGLQALSGAIDRNDDVLYICYDNEAYMNTGIQKSSLTPFGASTTTTPAGKREHGCLTQKKSLFDIVAAHRIPYAATASVGYLNDFIKKVERARDIKAVSYTHLNGAETLIMGAFGCGRNGYPVEQVIELIQNWIAEHPGAVPNVVFAVPRMHADAFREAFGAPEPERPAPVVVAEGENDREGDDEDWRNVELPEGVTLR